MANTLPLLLQIGASQMSERRGICLQDSDHPQENGWRAMTDSGYIDTSVQSQLIVMRAARSDPGGGEIPMKASKPFAICPKRYLYLYVRGVENKCDGEQKCSQTKRLKKRSRPVPMQIIVMLNQAGFFTYQYKAHVFIK